VTALKRRVRRVVETPASKTLVLILTPPDLIEVREKRRRSGYTTTAQALYHMLAVREADRRVEERRAKRRRPRGGMLGAARSR
jgi:hypothetical protein